MSNSDTRKSIKNLLAEYPDIKLAILYGSFLNNSETFNSDIDIAVAADTVLDSDKKMSIIEQLASLTGRH